MGPQIGVRIEPRRGPSFGSRMGARRSGTPAALRGRVTIAGLSPDFVSPGTTGGPVVFRMDEVRTYLPLPPFPGTHGKPIPFLPATGDFIGIGFGSDFMLGIVRVSCGLIPAAAATTAAAFGVPVLEVFDLTQPVGRAGSGGVAAAEVLATLGAHAVR